MLLIHIYEDKLNSLDSETLARAMFVDSSSACITSLRPRLIAAAGVVDNYTGAQTPLVMPGFYPIVHCVSF